MRGAALKPLFERAESIGPVGSVAARRFAGGPAEHERPSAFPDRTKRGKTPNHGDGA